MSATGGGDPFDLQRFVDAQDEGGTHEQALRELRAGRKESHWMWFVLPQLAGLGRSPTARRFGITGLAEAQAYLAHPVLGPRLVEAARALASLATADAAQVLGPVDGQKLRSSMTCSPTPPRTSRSSPRCSRSTSAGRPTRPRPARCE